MKKMLAGFLILLLSLVLLQTVAAAPEKVVTVKLLMPGDESAGFREMVSTALNPKLRSELGIEIQATWVPWSEYFQKQDLLFASGEEVDLCWTPFGNMTNFVAKGYTLPLNDLLEKHGQAIYKAIPRKNFEVYTYNGKIMAIPSQNAPVASKFYTVYYRSDLAEKVGITKPIESIAQMEDYLAKVQQKYPEAAHLGGFELIQPFSREEPGMMTLWGVREIYWFYVDDSKDENKVYSYFESEAFKKYCKKLREWNQKKYVPEDVLVQREVFTRMATGKACLNNGAISRFMEFRSPLVENFPDAGYAEYLINPGKPKVIENAGNEAYLIYAKAPHPVEAIRFLNWIFKSQDSYDLAIYGIKDKHYQLTPKGRVKSLTTDEFFYEWMFRNINFMRFPDWLSDKDVDRLKKWNEGVKFSKLFAFNFDEKPVQSELAQLMTAFTEYIEPLEWGFTDYDKVWTEVRGKLKEAGLDKLVAEAQRQFSDFYAKRKK